MSAKERDPEDQIRLDFASGVTASAAPGVDVVPAGGGLDAVLASAGAGSSRKSSKTARKSGGAAPEKAKSVRAGKPGTGERRRVSAAEMATKHREISVSEFFSKNRHLLGFDNPSKALLTTVKEGVDNSLDACEEAGILPEVRVEIHPEGDDRFRVVIEDNGPGIVRKQVPKIFGSLLYGSKFHVLKQSRGQQGI
ncbi:MAG: ATP-binding protein, partial [Candidatus Eisenbacteria bacterium]